MDYGKAKGIRKTKFGDMFAQHMLEGEGVGSSLKKTLSEKTKAKMAGIKETFDPMNMAKAVGGRGLAAMVGKMMGASDERMQHFAGKSKDEMELASDGKGGFSEEETKVLGQIYNAILKEREEKIKALGLEDEFQKQQISEEEKKTALLTEAVKGEKPKAEKPKKKPKKPPGSIIEGVIGGAVTAAAISDKEKEETAAKKEQLKNISNTFVQTNLTPNAIEDYNKVPKSNEIFSEMVSGLKPGGLWLSNDTEWRNLYGSDPEIVGPYVYVVDFDDSNL